jgi:hypothetical protein
MTNPLAPEMPDCAQCQHYVPENNDYYQTCRKLPTGYSRNCTNGSEFKPAEPIRLYTITSEDKTT